MALYDLKKIGPRHGEKWIVIEPVAFAHYRLAEKGCWLLNVGVDPAVQRKGLGQKILADLPRPIYLKTDAADPVSNGFYRKRGFRLIGSAKTRKGKNLNVWAQF